MKFKILLLAAVLSFSTLAQARTLCEIMSDVGKNWKPATQFIKVKNYPQAVPMVETLVNLANEAREAVPSMLLNEKGEITNLEAYKKYQEGIDRLTAGMEALLGALQSGNEADILKIANAISETRSNGHEEFKPEGACE